MKFRFSAFMAAFAGLCLAGSSFGQTNRKCGTVRADVALNHDTPAAACTTVGAEWLWARARMVGPVGNVAARPTLAKRTFLATRPLAPDNWNTESGNWSVAGNWTAGVPSSSSAVTIGNNSFGNVTEDLASASAGSLSILSGNTLSINSGNTLNVSGTTSTSYGSYLNIGASGNGGGTLANAGSFTNSGGLDVGNATNIAASNLTIAGTFASTGYLQVTGGSAIAGSSLLNVSGPAPTTLTGYYSIQGNVGSAIVEFASGGITTIGDGVSNVGSVGLSGPNAYLEVGATNSNSALTGLTTISGNGALGLANGASVTTSGALTNSGSLNVDSAGSGGSVMSIGGSLANSNGGEIWVGNEGMTSASRLDVSGTFSNTGQHVNVTGGSTAVASALIYVAGPAPAALTGNYGITANAGSAVVEFGSGSVTSISGNVTLSGSNAFMEVGPTNSNSALTGWYHQQWTVSFV